jgi:hypothetical protein
MKRILLLSSVWTIAFVACQSGSSPVITGELKKWHTITLTFNGPKANEEDGTNPFLDYRMDVTFRLGQHAFTVPGYFAADGDAGNSSATEGSKWRVHFSPDEEGEWSYYVSFRKGKEAALSYEPESLPKARYFDTVQGKFTVQPTDKTGRDLRGRGRLEYYNQRYWRFAETGDYLIKAGVADDNFLSCKEFDGNFGSDGRNDELIKSWDTHLQDWHPGDPVWQGDKGKGIIGAINYLAAQGMNGLAFLVLNLDGREENVFPYTSASERLRFDISRLDQWEAVMEHANRMGIVLQIRTQEGSNASLLDKGNLATERQLFYRMLIARFSHHPGLIWDLGESGGTLPLSERATSRPQTADQRLDMAQYFYENDPYLHPLLFRNSGEFSELLTTGSKYTATALYAPLKNSHEQLLHYHSLVEKRGLVWVVTALAPFRSLPTVGDSHQDLLRKQALWGTLMAGGAGIDYFPVLADGRTDFMLTDWRRDEPLWNLNRNALLFFRGLDMVGMENRDDLLSARDGFCLCKPGQIYALYLPNGGSTFLDLKNNASCLELNWFDPLAGEFVGTAKTVQGRGKVLLNPPPSAAGRDWAAILRSSDIKNN